MKKLKIKENIWWIGAIDYDLRVFDIIMYTEFGTTYNAYLVKGSEKTALFETVKHTFTAEFMKKLEDEMDLSTLDYIILDHTEPDHAGTVEALLEKATHATVVGSESAIRFMKSIANREFNSLIVKEGDEISLGDKTLRFIMAPFLHWPDSIYTYCLEDKVLFTCDSFGAHYAYEDMLFSKLDNEANYKKALKYYFDMIFGPFKKYMLSAISKIENIEVDMICPGHGPVLDENPKQIVDLSREWATQVKVQGKSIVIPYVSAYGYTKQIAEKMKMGIESIGQVEVKLHDLVYAKKEAVYADIDVADGLLFGSPTINSDALEPIMDILIHLSPIVHGGKFAAAFGSYGWSGEAVDHLTSRLKQLRMKVVKGYKVNFKPSYEELFDAYTYGQQFAKYVLGYEAYAEEDVKELEGGNDNTVKLWRCVICGEVFEGVNPPNICPACGATKEQFEVYVKEEVLFSSSDKKKIVVIGNGAAGISAVEAIRERNKEADITVIDKEGYNIYYRPMLSDYLSDEEVMKNIFLHDIEWYQKNDINYKRGLAVVGINTIERQIILENDDMIYYDRLVIAAGSKSFVPPIQNANIKGVFTLRTMTDAKNIKTFAEECKNAIVIGGGLLGLEAADQLKAMGLEVTVVEVFERILPRQLDTAGAALLEAGILKTGINLVKGCSVSEIIGENGVTGVKLNTGTELVADIVLISAGIKADIQLAKDSGINCDRGIIVDNYMQTNDPNIFAAGDVAEFGGINYAIWPEAVMQGKIAGANAVGDLIEYKGMVPSTVFNGMNMNVFSIGEVNAASGVVNMVYEDVEKSIYKRLIFRDNRLIGGIIIGDNSKSKLLIDGVANGYVPNRLLDVFKV